MRGVRGAILAGGGATRFGGRAKGLEVVAGRRILDRLIDVFGEAFDAPPLLVANDPGAATWRPDLQVVSDVLPGYGTLSGLLTAVRAAPAPVVCAAWDMPFLSSSLLVTLAAGLDGHDVYLPASGGRRGVEPLCAAYGPACGPAIERSIGAGDLRAIGFHAFVRVGILSEDAVRAFGEPARLFFNVNTAQDLVRAQELA